MLFDLLFFLFDRSVLMWRSSSIEARPSTTGVTEEVVVVNVVLTCGRVVVPRGEIAVVVVRGEIVEGVEGCVEDMY